MLARAGCLHLVEGLVGQSLCSSLQMKSEGRHQIRTEAERCAHQLILVLCLRWYAEPCSHRHRNSHHPGRARLAADCRVESSSGHWGVFLVRLFPCWGLGGIASCAILGCDFDRFFATEKTAVGQLLASRVKRNPWISLLGWASFVLTISSNLYFSTSPPLLRSITCCSNSQAS